VQNLAQKFSGITEYNHILGVGSFFY